MDQEKIDDLAYLIFDRLDENINRTAIYSRSGALHARLNGVKSWKVDISGRHLAAVKIFARERSTW